MSPLLRVLVDGDPQQIYGPRDKVTGTVIFVAEKQEQIKSLKLNFTGACITKTTRPCYVGGNDGDAVSSSRRIYKEQVPLFSFERILMASCTAGANKCSWSFEFQFPEHTQTRYSKRVHGSHYSRDIHPLPPSFHIYTNEPGGEAMIKYSVQAKLIRSGLKVNKRASYTLAFSNTSRGNLHEPRDEAHVLSTQTLNLTKAHSDKHTLMQKISHIITRNPSLLTPCVHLVPTVHIPEAVAPGQTIPISLSLLHLRRHTTEPEHPTCTLDTLSVTLSTYTRSTCGRLISQPQDVLAKHISCISRRAINTSVPLDSTPVALVRNFRLLDTAECIPSFATYTIARHYALSIDIGLKCFDKFFHIRSTHPLEILPRLNAPSPLDVLRGDCEEPVDPLPLYERTPQLSVAESAPEYSEVVETADAHEAAEMKTLSTAPSTLYDNDNSDDDSDGDSGLYSSEPVTPLTRPVTPELEAGGSGEGSGGGEIPVTGEKRS